MISVPKKNIVRSTDIGDNEIDVNYRNVLTDVVKKKMGRV
jgi:hypothetical protein